MADAIAFLLAGFAMVAFLPTLKRANRQAQNVIVEYKIRDYHNRYGADNWVFCTGDLCHEVAGRADVVERTSGGSAASHPGIWWWAVEGNTKMAVAPIRLRTKEQMSDWV
jgi:hypothetical protein